MSTGELHTSLVEDAHKYTRSTCPWILEGPTTAGGKLFRYISGGGMRAFGRTIRQEEIRRRHIRFWGAAATFAALWLLFWIF